MRIKVKRMNSFVVTWAILSFGLVLVCPATPQAQPKVVAIEGVSYNVDGSMAENLKSLTGKRVTLTLNSGKTFTGYVKAIGKQMVHLEKMDGKEYFDALIIIGEISGIDTRFRSD